MARHVNCMEPRGECYGWFTCSICENQFAVAKAVMADIDRVGGTEEVI